MNVIKKFIIMVAAMLLALPYAQAQLGNDGTGSRDPAALTKAVELFTGCKSKVVSFDGTAQTQQIVSGPGLLAGVEIVSASEGNTTTANWRVSFYNASLSEVTLASPSLAGSTANAKKIIPDQFGGPIGMGQTGVSTGGAFTAATLSNTRNNTFRHPVRFTNGIVIENGTAANHGSMAIYWLD